MVAAADLAVDRARAIDRSLSMIDVDGVPCFWAPAPGATSIGLITRVGVVDEPIELHGVTHLVEHAAHATIRRPHYDWNATTHLTTSEFWASGDPDSAADHLAAIARGLHAITDERVALERNVLAAESRNWAPTVRQRLLQRRFGASTYGAGALPEWGLPSLAGATARDWARRWFTRENSVIYVIGELPRALRCPLPDGVPIAAPPVPSPERWATGPQWQNLAGAAAFDMVTTDTTAAKAFAQILAWRMHDRLREQRGLSYDTQVHLEPIDARVAQIWHALDANGSDALAESVHEVLQIVRSLAEGGVTQSELRDLVPLFDHSLLGTHANGSNARRHALAHLFGVDAPTRVQQRAAIASLDRAAFTATASVAADTFVLMAADITPCDAECEGTLLLTPTELWQDRGIVDGTTFNADGAVALRITVGDDGISEHHDHPGVVCFAWADVRGVITWANGYTVVQGPHTRINLAPWEWDHGEMLIDLVRSTARAAGRPIVEMDPDTGSAD